MAKKLERGLFITFEGPEGSGKSTHSGRLAEDLLADGYSIVHTAEPGGTVLGEKLRGLLLNKNDFQIGALTELLLFEADRAQHVEELIIPSLEAGKIVLCDRFNTATFAYQGYGLGMDMDMIKIADAISTKGLNPDLTILLDIDIETGLVRAVKNSSADRMEERCKEFHQKVRQGYLAIAKESPETIKVIEVNSDIDRTYELVKNEVMRLINARG